MSPFAATGTVAAGAAEGAGAKLLAVPLGVIVAALVVLSSRRDRRRFEPLAGDRKLAALLLIAVVLSVVVVVLSLTSTKKQPVVVVTGRSPGGSPAPETTRPESHERVLRPAAGYAPSDRPTYECTTDRRCEAGVDHVVFNSYINTSNYGDERAFFDAKPSGHSGPGGFRDVLLVQRGDRVTIRVYIHNNADAIAARDTRLTILLPQNPQAKTLAAANIEASNASPQAVSDTVTFLGREPIRVELDDTFPPTITQRPHPKEPWVTKLLPATRFISPHTAVADLGTWQPGFAAGALITATVRIV